MVSTVDHLATGAGISALRAGGSAADAAIAANAVLAVTAPNLCGMGGDLFALVHAPGMAAPAVLNASGRAGSGADAERMRAEGLTSMPFRGDIRSVPVPGCVDGWMALHARFGRLPLAEILAPAIDLAEHGFPCSPLLAVSLMGLARVEGAESLHGDGQTRRAGERITRPGVARALRAIAADGRAGFYGGEFGDGLIRVGAGEYTTADLERATGEWVEPLSVRVWDHDLWTVPPNSQGYLTLASAWIASGLDLPEDPDDPEWAHLLVESCRQASYDRPAVLHDRADGAALLATDRLDARRHAIRPDRAAALPAPPVRAGDTTYLCALDGDGFGVSLIQSNASGFGSHVFEPSTGINLHNRGLGFSLEPGHPAEYTPGRRPPHTLSPALVTRTSGELAALVGTMGGDAQPQIILQVATRLLRHRQSPARAVASGRFALSARAATTGFATWTDPQGVAVHIEGHAPAGWLGGLEARGHVVERAPTFDAAFGHAHAIVVTDHGLAGAADPRARIGACSGY